MECTRLCDPCRLPSSRRHSSSKTCTRSCDSLSCLCRKGVEFFCEHLYRNCFRWGVWKRCMKEKEHEQSSAISLSCPVRTFCRKKNPEKAMQTCKLSIVSCCSSVPGPHSRVWMLASATFGGRDASCKATIVVCSSEIARSYAALASRSRFSFINFSLAIWVVFIFFGVFSMMKECDAPPSPLWKSQW